MKEEWLTEQDLLDLMPSPPQTPRELELCARIARFIQAIRRLREARTG